MVLLRCDLHVHTNASRDGESPVHDVIAAAKAAGLDAIAITDHDTMEGVLEALKMQDPDLLIIPGVEVSTKQGHLLVLGTDRIYPPKEEVLKTIADAKQNGAVTIVPHPFHRWRHGVGLRKKQALKEADAIEGLNSRYIIGTANQKAVKKARKYDKLVTAGSDAHTAELVGFGVTEIECSGRSVEAILDAIRNRRIRQISYSCRKTPLRTYTRQSWKNTVRKVRRIPHRRSGRRVHSRKK
jgi:predicted metal-dependent phosphoesterase TrpH